ncbi:MAG: hypothetical protein K2H15_02945, partial [Muribaculaceae bacterium]|nr:hypothetical protein [Muribaculaceae bacterium]
MKKRCIIFLLFSLSFLIDGFAATSDNSELVQTLRAKIVDSPDSVLAKLDDIEAQNSQALPSFQINLLRSLAYNEKRMFSLVERYAMRALASDSISTHKKEYLNALTLLSVAQSYFGNYQGSIATSIKGMEM